MSMGKRTRDRQPAMWVTAMNLPTARESSLLSSVESGAARARLRRLRRSAMCRLLRRHHGPPQLAPPGIYFRLLLIGYFEGIDSERGIAWRAADSFALRDFLGLVLPEAPPDYSTVSRTRRLIDLETHEAVFTWMLQRLADAGLVRARPAASVPRSWKPMRPWA